jgi:hypothetical protein
MQTSVSGLYRQRVIPHYDASDMKACCIKISVYILATIIGCSGLTH